MTGSALAVLRRFLTRSFSSMSRNGALDGLEVDGCANVQDLIQRFREEWRLGREPDLDAYWRIASASGCDLYVLTTLIKIELAARFLRGERPTAAEYFARLDPYPDHSERIISVVYEEFCLLEELGETPDTAEFCDRYGPLGDSIASQLRLHSLFNDAVSRPSPPKFPRVGDSFLGYRLVRELGRGGSARVYLAEDPELGSRPVALKVSPNKGEEPSLQGRLDHPNIVPVHAVRRDEENGLRALSMPFRPGRTLDDVLRMVWKGRRRPRRADVFQEALADIDGGEAGGVGFDGWAGFPRRRGYIHGCAWIAACIARALAHAHQRGVRHLDVKPANVLLTAAEGPKLLDFNLAQESKGPQQALTALRGGTLPYMAPEQLRAFLDDSRWEEVGSAADVYSLGLVLREMLTGRRPEAPDPELPPPRAIAALLDLRTSTPTGPKRLDSSIPGPLDAIVRKCLEPDASRRFASAADLADELNRYVAGEAPRRVSAGTNSEALTSWAVRRRRPLAAATLGIATLSIAWLVVVPGVASLTYGLGKEAARDNRSEEAVRLLTVATRLAPSDTLSWAELAAARQTSYDYAGAHDAWERAIALGGKLDAPVSPSKRAEMMANDVITRVRLVESEMREPVEGRPVACERLIALLNRCLIDVRSGRALAGGDVTTQCILDLSEATVNVTRGNLLNRRNDPVAAKLSYRKAREALDHFDSARRTKRFSRLEMLHALYDRLHEALERLPVETSQPGPARNR